MKNLKVENFGMVDVDRNAQRTQIERIGALMRNGSADRRGAFAAMCELTPIAEGVKFEEVNESDARGLRAIPPNADPARAAFYKICHRLMSTPGVGALVALTYRSAVDDPTRFGKSSTVGAYFGLTPKKYQSGETDRDGGVSKVGDAMVRTAPFEAAHIMLTRATRFSSLKRWALEVAKRRGMKRAKVCPGAQTRRLAPSHVDGRHRLSLGDNCNGRLKGKMLIEARRQRHASNEVPSLGRGLGKIVCSAVNASANHAS